jgi:hypothetical protein
MKRISIILYIFFIAAPFCQILSQNTVPENNIENKLEGNTGAGVKSNLGTEIDQNIKGAQETGEKKKKSFNVNIDSKIMYGMYNNLFTYFSLAQSFDKFSYQLNASLARSNDYGYRNTSFYEVEAGFSGIAEFTETWKFIPQIEVTTESHGMYDNAYYSREEKDKIIATLKNEYKPTPSRWDFNVGGGQYVHRLVSATTSDVDKNEFYKLNGEIGWEYVWSASNKFRIDSQASYYNYSPWAADDLAIYNEFIWSFKLLEYLKIEPGFIYIWNIDAGHFPSGKINVSSSGLKYTSLELSYVYDLIPFKPEELYFEQKFVDPDYELPPGKAHHLTFKGSLDFKFSSENKAYLKLIKVKVAADFEDNSAFCNYYPLAENVLSASTLHTLFYTIKADFIFDLAIYQTMLRLALNYQYMGFSASKNITYRPEHRAEAILRLTTKWIDVEWGNAYNSSVYVNPDTGKRLDWFVLGNIEVQGKVLESFSIFARVNNLYAEDYNLRDGYPEPGIIFLGGLRVVI